MNEEEKLEKSASSSSPTEEFLRASLKKVARESYKPVKINLNSEYVGIACEITQIKDPSEAVKELINQALINWDKLKYFERLASEQEEDDEMLNKSEK